MKYRFAVAMATGFLISTAVLAQNPPNGTPPPGAATGRPGTSTGPKPYSEVITSKAKTSKGLFTTHRQDDKYFFEIPDSLLEREILVVNRISKAPAGSRAGFFGYAGDQISDNVISFEKGPNNKIFLRAISHSERGRDSSGMYVSVRNSNLQPINASFNIAAYKTDSLTGVKSSVIELTDYISGDNDILFFDSRLKRALGLTQYQKDNSYIIDVKSFANNVEIQTVKTYMRTPTSGGFGQPAPSPAMMGSGSPSTFELNSSMVLLPKTAMKPRYFDPRVGYFATGYTDFDANPQGVETIRMITRWKLEPKPEDVQKYLRGELVEPAKQIVYYIDPATPKKWVPYLIQGVNDWNIAFEKAGWKNAIVAKEAPVNDPSWSLEGAGYSAIVYKPSDIPNASGPHVHDPRSGEILESHINWYHNVMTLLRDWYFIQTSAVDPRARNMVFEDELMGQLIRFVSSHEVGHTLGLRHNFGSSSTVPVENLRNKSWVEEHGHTPSIMDYARFNYVAQPEDNISEKGLFPRIGDYDKWAIEWGYRWMPQATAEAEVPLLNKMTIERLQDKRLWFGTETDPDDPRGQNEDLGDDAMKASAYGIKNLQRIIAKLPEWTKEANKDYSSLTQMYSQLRSQYGRYMGHVAKSVGGIYTTPKMTEQPGVVVEFVDETKQKAAIRFLQDNLFKTPKWLVENNISDYTGDNKLATVGNIQNSVLNRLLGASTFNKLARFEAEEPAKAYTAYEMVTDLRKGIWTELATKQPIDIYRRNLQKSFVETLDKLINPPPMPTLNVSGFGAVSTTASNTSDAVSVAKAQLRLLQAEIRAALPAYRDISSRAHLQDIVDRITESLNPNK